MATLQDRRLRGMDFVELLLREGDLSRRRAAAAETALRVLFESEHTLVVDKAPGLVTVPDRSGTERGVHGQLEALRPGDDLRIVHRLDRDTSGCLILAKGIAAARHFDAQFRAQAVHKRYVALVVGAVAGPEQRIELFLGPHPGRPGKVATSAAPRPGFAAATTTVRAAAAF